MSKSLWWVLPVCVVLGFGASLIGMLLLSKILRFPLDSTTAVIVSMIIAASSGATLTAVFLLKKK